MTELTADCPLCLFEVPISDDILSGEIITCPNCDIELEVWRIGNEVKLKVLEEGEDWGE